MTILKRAFLSIQRKKVKSLVLILLFFIIGNTIAGTVAIRQAAVNVEQRIKQALGPVVTIGPNLPKLIDAINQQPTTEEKEFIVTSASGLETIPIIYSPDEPGAVAGQQKRQAEYQQMGQSSYVKSYDIALHTSVGSDSLQLIRDKSETNELDNYFGFPVNGTDYAPIQSLEEGRTTLVAGRTFTADEISQGRPVVLITKAFADLNQISVGDTIELTKYATLVELKDFFVGQVDLRWQVIGILQDQAVPDLAFDRKKMGQTYDDGTAQWYQLVRQNSLLVPNQLIRDLSNQVKQMLVETGLPEDYPMTKFDPDASFPMFVLKQADDVIPFMQEYGSLLPDTEKFYANQNIYSQISAPVQQTKKMANSALLFPIGAAILIISLVVVMSLKDRKYELGILMSLGERNSNIIRQMMLEVLLLAMLGLAPSLLTGQVIANQLTDSMIQQELMTEVYFSDNDDFWQSRLVMGQYANHMTSQEIADSYQIRFTPGYFLSFILISLGTTLLATIVPTWYIVNLKPKQVLMA